MKVLWVTILRKLYTRQLFQKWRDKHIGLFAAGVSLMVLGNLPRQLLSLPTHWLTWTIWVPQLLINVWMLLVALLCWRDYLLRLREEPEPHKSH